LISRNHTDEKATDGSFDDGMPLDLAIDDDPDLRLRMGRYLGGIRLQKKISQQQAAKGIPMSRPHLSNIERGRARTGWKGLREMAHYYGYGIQQLITEVERDKPAGSMTQISRLLDPPIEPPAATPAPPDDPPAAPPDDPPIERDVYQMLSDYERFVIGMIRVMDPEDRPALIQQISKSVQCYADKHAKR
jgi:transcriptional regulator with XRE-family HTH domain